MIVSISRRVSEKTMSEHANEGKGFDDIQFELGDASQCGSCEDCARELIESCHAKAGATQQSWRPVAMHLSR